MLKKILIYFLAAGFAAAAFVTISHLASAESNHTFTVVNESSFTINHIHMSSTSDPRWRRDLLGKNNLPSGHQYTARDIRPGHYNIEVIDQDNDSCTMKSVRVDEDITWTLTPLGLVECEIR